MRSNWIYEEYVTGLKKKIHVTYVCVLYSDRDHHGHPGIYKKSIYWGESLENIVLCELSLTLLLQETEVSITALPIANDSCQTSWVNWFISLNEKKRILFFNPLWFSDVFMNWTSSLRSNVSAKACLKEVTAPRDEEWQEAVSFTQIIHGSL